MSEGARYDAIIIGGGPGGLTAGLYLARAGKKTLLLEQGLLGGQLATAGKVENYPGFPDGVSGKELTELFEKQATNFGLEVQFGRVEALKDPGGDKEVIVSGFPFLAPVVIVATGLLQKLGVPGEDEFLGRGVSYCATCDGALYRGRPVAVVGSSEFAMEEAHFLVRFAAPVYLVVSTPELKPNSELRAELLAHPSVRVVGNVRPAEILGDASGVTGLRLAPKGGDGPIDLAVEGVFAFAGKKKPGTDFLRDLLPVDEEGYLSVDDACETPRKGIYAVGDVRRHRFHQVSTAVGDGAVAAMDALRYLR